MFYSLASIVARRRWAGMILALFVIGALALGSLQPKLQEDSAQAPADTWLPSGAESYEALQAQEELFDRGDVTPGLVVFAREDGDPLGPEDISSIGAFVDELEGAAGDGPLQPVTSITDPQAAAPGQLLSEDRSVAMVPFELGASDQPTIQPAVDEIRERATDAAGDELVSHVTGPAGLVVDSVEVFESIDVTLLMATMALILVLLLAIYRSPLVALVPIFVVALSYMVAAGIVYMGTQVFDQAVNQQSTAILIVLMFGAGTDYCLLLVARYREELHHADPADAMRVALPATAPAILASGGTVVVAMLTLLVADYDPTRQMGPILSVGIAVMIFAGLTLLPAVLVLLGRRSFWPAVPRIETMPPVTDRRWGRIASAVARHPRRAVLVPVLVLGFFALGNTSNLPLLGFGSSDTFRTTTDSGEGVELLATAFPAGELATNQVVLRAGADEAQVDAAAAAVAAALADEEGVARATPGTTTDGGALVDVVLEGDPFGEEEAELVPDLRDAARDAASSVDEDVEVLLGGPTAQAFDTNEAVQRDTRVAVPLILVVVFAVLVVLLRAIVAPLHLLASVVLGFFATIGLMTWLFANVLDQPGADAGFAFFVFLFAVALGVDYNIFLVHRIREETRRLGSTREGTIAGLATTGGVITSAGLILAGTFSVLAVLPVLFLFQLGAAVAVGVLLDTFVVRTFVVPGAMLLLGRRNWWPGHGDLPTDPPEGPGNDPVEQRELTPA